MTEDMTIIGKEIPLKDGHTRVTGTLKYARDYTLPEAAWMKVLRSPYAHAKIRGIDTSKAEALPGVHAVITHKNVPQREILCPILNWKSNIMEDRTRFVGDEVAAVAAETEEIAEEACNLIEVDYEKLPTVFDMEEAIKPDAPKLFTDANGVETNIVKSPPDPGLYASLVEIGDIKKGLEEADATADIELRTQRVYTAFFPGACIAEWDGDKLTLILSHQVPFDNAKCISQTLEIPQHKIRIIAPPLPGSFGHFNSAQRFWFLAALLSKKAGRPVIYKMTMEEFGVYKARDSEINRVQFGAKKDGTVTALNLEVLHDNGAYGYKTTSYCLMYDVFTTPNLRYSDVGVCVNKFSTGCLRGVGNIPATPSVNQAVDTVAEKLGLDPRIIWKKNHIKAKGEVRLFYPEISYATSEAYDELIDKGSEAIEWERKWKGWGKPYKVIGSKRRAVGMAVSNYLGGVPPLSGAALVNINSDGTAQVTCGTMELGQGPKTIFAQICAETLGFKIENVDLVRDVDTQTFPYMCMTGASTSTFIGTPLVKKAAEDAKRQLLEAALTKESGPETLKKGVKSIDELDIKDSMIYVKADPSRCEPVELVTAFGTEDQVPMIIGRANMTDYPLDRFPSVALVGFADVEVDTETGQVKVLNVIQCDDAGRIINPATSRNQYYGGTAQSLGYALMEEVAFDPVTGKVLNPALVDYWMVGSLDMSPVEVIFSEGIDPVSAYGVKGMGECSAMTPHAAIASAVYNAIGVRISQLPMTPDRILKALGKIK